MAVGTIHADRTTQRRLYPCRPSVCKMKILTRSDPTGYVINSWKTATELEISGYDEREERKKRKKHNIDKNQNAGKKFLKSFFSFV